MIYVIEIGNPFYIENFKIKCMWNIVSYRDNKFRKDYCKCFELENAKLIVEALNLYGE